jgi:allantoinase
VLPLDAPAAGREVVLAPDEVLVPGLVDSHVHVNEPGRTEWEGFATATRAAAAGGVTTIVDMPLNSLPPTVDVAALEVKRAAAAGRCAVDVAFWGGAVPGNEPELRALHDAGPVGVKCFLIDSGVPEFPPLLDPGPALAEIAAFDGLLIAHAEDGALVTAAAGRRYADFVASRPAAAEDSAIGLLLRRARETGARVHVVHLSSASALPLLAAARADGVRVTVETCPHYLALTAEEVPDGDTRYKCCPPVRGDANRDALWRGLADGVIDMVVSDHSPCPPDLKRLDTGDFGAAWGGISSLQLGLPVVWTEARRRGRTLAEVVTWMAARPAALVGLPRKGRIAAGADADLAVVAPDAEFTVGELHHRHPLTPYTGRRLHGVVRRTWLRGAPVDPAVDAAPRGRLLTRGTA